LDVAVALVLSAGAPVVAEVKVSPFANPVVENVKAGTVVPATIDRLLAVTLSGALDIASVPLSNWKL
jgi:hypothetical protein